jgi:hypothetical protein
MLFPLLSEKSWICCVSCSPSSSANVFLVLRVTSWFSRKLSSSKYYNVGSSSSSVPAPLFNSSVVHYILNDYCTMPPTDYSIFQAMPPTDYSIFQALHYNFKTILIHAIYCTTLQYDQLTVNISVQSIYIKAYEILHNNNDRLGAALSVGGQEGHWKPGYVCLPGYCPKEMLL